MEIVQKYDVKEYLPPQNGWYDTNKGNLYFFVVDQIWSCRDDKISDEYPVWWLNRFETSIGKLNIPLVNNLLPLHSPDFGIVDPELVKIDLDDLKKCGWDHAKKWIEELRLGYHQWANAYHNLNRSAGGNNC